MGNNRVGAEYSLTDLSNKLKISEYRIKKQCNILWNLDIFEKYEEEETTMVKGRNTGDDPYCR